MAPRRRAEALEKARRGRDRPLVGLEKHRRELVVMGVDQRLGGPEVVVGRHEHLALERVRDAGRVGHGCRERLRRARGHAHEPIVVGAVEATLELQDLLALAEGARHAKREERRLAPARRVAHLLGAWHRPHDLFGQLDRGLVEEEVRGAARHLALDRRDDGRMRVAEQHRPRAQEVVEVPAAVHVPEVGAPALLDDELEPGTAPVAAEHAAGQHLRGASNQIVLVGHARLASVRRVER